MRGRRPPGESDYNPAGTPFRRRHNRVPMDYAKQIKEIGRGAKGARSLSRDDARALFGDMLDGRVPPLQLGAIVIALRVKSESLDELLGFQDALRERVTRIDAPGGMRTVVLPTYNGARRRPNLMPLVALLLARAGVPVLIHGRFDFDSRADPFALLRELDMPMATDAAHAAALLSERRIACIGVDALAPGLDALLSLRPQLGVRNSAHSMTKMIDPLPGRSVRVVPVTHPEYLERMSHFLREDGGRSILMRGTEGEAYANPARRPVMTGFVDGREERLFEQEDGEPLGSPEPAIVADMNARVVLDMYEGRAAVPAPLADQVTACIRLARER